MFEAYYWKPSAATKHHLSLLHLLMNALTKQNSLIILGGFDPVLPSWKPNFFLPSTLSPLLPISFCPFSLLKDEMPAPQSSHAPHTHNVKILALPAGYLFPASHHLTCSLSSAAQQICCAVLNQGVAKEVRSLQKLRQVGSAGDALLSPSTLSGGVILLWCLSTVFVCREVAGF